ncbi:uncharacterized protein LOC120208672 [Hibiscus syriacus]|uniref:uncharacterized protein LOC120208672 n=1 Tax=Hibiscus syriacus TaxID=106335 RepID=UPI001924A811|nr:uncharacterized protein LOC120208672 [Hibiscus syriacus]
MAARYVFDGEVLYKKSHDQILLRCVVVEEAKMILEEVHNGVCGTYENGHMMSRQIMRCGLAVIMSEAVGDSQFTFIHGKQIADCSIITNEIIDDISRRKRQVIVIKADFRKAYDSVDWKFLDIVLKLMSFWKKWRKWIQLCDSAASISVLISGIPTEKFNNRRG